LNFSMRLTRRDDERSDRRDAQGLPHVPFWFVRQWDGFHGTSRSSR
jgi:hypothetical protein